MSVLCIIRDSLLNIQLYQFILIKFECNGNSTHWCVLLIKGNNIADNWDSCIIYYLYPERTC